MLYLRGEIEPRSIPTNKAKKSKVDFSSKTKSFNVRDLLLLIGTVNAMYLTFNDNVPGALRLPHLSLRERYDRTTRVVLDLVHAYKTRQTVTAIQLYEVVQLYIE